MPINLACDCGRQLTLKPNLAGKKIRCPSCDETLRVPDGKKKKAVGRRVTNRRDTNRPAKRRAPASPPARKRGPKRTDPWDLDKFGVRQEAPPVSMPAPVGNEKEEGDWEPEPYYTSSISQYESEQSQSGFHIDSAMVNMLVGGLFCIGGIIATVLSYDAANAGGGYYVFYGAIIFGAIQFGRGLFESMY